MKPVWSLVPIILLAALVWAGYAYRAATPAQATSVRGGHGLEEDADGKTQERSENGIGTKDGPNVPDRPNDPPEVVKPKKLNDPREEVKPKNSDPSPEEVKPKKPDIPPEVVKPKKPATLEGDVLLLVVHTDGSRFGKGDLNAALMRLRQSKGKVLLGQQIYLVDKNGHRPMKIVNAKDGLKDVALGQLLERAWAAVEALTREARNQKFRTLVFLEVDGDPGDEAKEPSRPADRDLSVCYLYKDSDEDSKALNAWFPGNAYRLKEVKNFESFVGKLLGK